MGAYQLEPERVYGQGVSTRLIIKQVPIDGGFPGPYTFKVIIGGFPLKQIGEVQLKAATLISVSFQILFELGIVQYEKFL